METFEGDIVEENYSALREKCKYYISNYKLLNFSQVSNSFSASKNLMPAKQLCRYQSTAKVFLPLLPREYSSLRTAYLGKG